MKNKIFDKLAFWIWHKNIAIGLSDNPVGAFIWSVRVATVYKPLFERSGWEAVAEEHNKYVTHLTKRVPDSPSVVGSGQESEEAASG